MCGIAGIYSQNNTPIQHFQIREMVNAISHRGPDGRDAWVNQESVGLGHVLLHTTPESFFEKQPFEMNGCCITADARIDNRDELLPLLGYDSSSVASVPDSEILLSSYQKWGQDFVARIKGDFAFAIWDTRKQELICGRDIFGVKPFYYQKSSDWFIFGSEIKAILAFPQSSNRFNEDWLANLYYHDDAIQEKTHTFYKNIQRLPPAHILRVNSSGLTLTRYWSFDPQRVTILKSDDEYAEALRYYFQRAVQKRMRSAFPIGSTVSGGLDSSAIACMLHKLNPDPAKPIHTFSAVYQVDQYADESQYINAVIQQPGFQPHLLYPDHASAFIDLNKVLWHMDEPFYGTNYFMPWSIFRSVNGHGVRIFMDGTDGDGTISHGKDQLELLAQAEQWEEFYKETQMIEKRFNNPRYADKRSLLLQHGAPQLTEWVKKGKILKFSRGVRKINRQFRFTTRNLIVNWGVKPFLPNVMLKFWKRVRNRPVSDSKVSEILTPALTSNYLSRKRQNRPSVNAIENIQQSGRKLHFIGLNNGMITYSLEWLNRMASAFAIDMRYPFCDRDLAEFCLSIPADQKLRNGWTRYVFRNAMKNILPETVCWRGGKASFYKVFPQMIKQYDQDFVNDILQNPPPIIHNYVNMDLVRKTYRVFLEKNQYDYVDLVWQTVVLAAWLRQGNYSTG